MSRSSAGKSLRITVWGAVGGVRWGVCAVVKVVEWEISNSENNFFFVADL